MRVASTRKVLILALVALAVALVAAACSQSARYGWQGEEEVASLVETPTGGQTATPTPADTGPTPTRASLPTDPLELGRAIFTGDAGLAQPACKSCHKVGGEVDGAEVGPDLAGIAGRAGGRTGASAEDYIRESILEPGAYVVDGYGNIMPPVFGAQLSDEQVDALVQWLMTQ